MAKTIVNRKVCNVIVKINNTIGKYLLQEIYPRLKEGDVLRGKLIDNAFQFQWYDNDAVLWLGDNCEITHKRNAINL